MNEESKKWTKSNVPSYDSDRVTAEYIPDCSDKRHLYHKQVIKIDGVVVNTILEYEDDDWSSYNSSNEEAISCRQQWDNWVATLED
jgi:hypothetical protein